MNSPPKRGWARPQSERQAAWSARPPPPLWLTLLLAAMAGGMGWGIRGQYGHETGAMIAGLLVSLALAFLFCPDGASLPVARAVALGTIGISLGGSLTYGQTIGLTQDAGLLGNWAALRWGLFGLFIKGAIWIGFAGAFLGMALGGQTYRTRDWAALLGAMWVLYLAGVWLLNEPFDPAHRVLPKIYFSADWRWLPNAELVPRRERWGGLLFAWLGVIVYAGRMRRDGLAWRLALWGALAGGLGFSLGQGVQAFHAWNDEFFRNGLWGRIDPLINWWNAMEIVFGSIWGAVLALGLWLNRRLIQLPHEPVPVTLSPRVEGALVCAHITLLLGWTFLSPAPFEALLDTAIPAAMIPLLAVTAGRYWPYLMALPLVALPIAGKTLRQLCYVELQLPVPAGWGLYVAIPLVLTTAAAICAARHANERDRARRFTRWALLGTTWLYFSLNFAFFHFPWPWTAWTTRTPSAVVFALCTAGITWVTLTRKGGWEATETPATQPAGSLRAT